MTYNIRGALGMDKKRSIARIADVIRASGSQIICLQEVHQRLPWSNLTDQAKWLGERLGMRFVFQRNVSFGVGGFGNAALSKADVITTRSHRLTSTGEPRGLLEIQFRTTEGSLTVFCTHLGLDGEERIVQAKEIATVVNATLGPKLICGDFNEDVTQPAVALLVASTGLVDASQDGSPTFCADTPTRRIDIVLCDPSIRVLRTSVTETIASDHLPVMVELALPGAQSVGQADSLDRSSGEQ